MNAMTDLSTVINVLEARKILESVPQGSGLYRYCVDSMVDLFLNCSKEKKVNEDFNQLVKDWPSFAADFVVRLSQSKGEFIRPLKMVKCTYHQHGRDVVCPGNK